MTITIFVPTFAMMRQRYSLGDALGCSEGASSTTSEDKLVSWFDQFLSNNQIMLKSFSRLCSDIKKDTGATSWSEGAVARILDIAQIMRSNSGWKIAAIDLSPNKKSPE
ncbi:hypothetical protein TG4357_02269 [Thalassovita gelatinovora]|uniref:Uncharacterized protein n=1 Tax=Thalassovita gelatinovora TaxID=53501 RepID=A0A0P1FDC8_THAGE|nr:hypothetical protein [Thalassovita gelatinovora]QIZ79963.1 hypothetical protein HFZ77_05430 [Thalassovita gelatinovora]CUH66161.1 hypothetical protein TG4357_02269 [Thalassovita gelatinovora]SER21306.1 hypothetical protein SAMN04488043_1252 [Thalassovita gelatinovora]